MCMHTASRPYAECTLHLHVDCTLLLAGAHGPDLVIFLGLAVYAVAGCKAQDLRVESSNQVGTVTYRAAYYVLARGCFRDSAPSPTCRSSLQPYALLGGYGLPGR